MIDLVSDIISSKEKISMAMPNIDARELNNVLVFGFSYVEHTDHFVSYIVTNPLMMKRLFMEMSDSEVGMGQGSVGNLWTAKLLVSKRVKQNHLLFSNDNFSAVLDLVVNTDNE